MNEKNNIEGIIKTISFLSIILILIGFAYNLIFYAFFSINITHYISASEIILSSFTNILIPLFILFTIFVVYVGVEAYSPEHQKNEIKFFKTLYSVVSIINIIISIYLYFLSSRSNFYESLIFLAVFSIGYLSTALSHNFLKIEVDPGFSNLQKMVMKYAYMLIVFFYIIILTVLFNYGAIMLNVIDSAKFDFYFKENKIVKSNDTLFFLGRTDKYLFLIDRKNDSTVIYSTDGLEEIKFHR